MSSSKFEIGKFYFTTSVYPEKCQAWKCISLTRCYGNFENADTKDVIKCTIYDEITRSKDHYYQVAPRLNLDSDYMYEKEIA